MYTFIISSSAPALKRNAALSSFKYQFKRTLLMAGICAAPLMALVAPPVMADAPPPAVKVKKSIKHAPKAKKKKAIPKKRVLQSRITLMPKVYSEALQSNPFSDIPKDVIADLMRKIRLIDAQAPTVLPRVIAGDEKKSMFAVTDNIYAQNQKQANFMHGDMRQNWQIFTIGKPVYAAKSATGTAGQLLAYEGEYAGILTHLSSHAQGVERFSIDKAAREIQVGDYVLPSTPSQYLSFSIPKQPVHAQILSMQNTATYGAKGSVVLINQGSSSGLEIGSVLSVYSPVNRVLSADQLTVQDAAYAANAYKHSSQLMPKTLLPQLKKGGAVVFDVAPSVSYAYVYQSDDAVAVGDELIDQPIESAK